MCKPEKKKEQLDHLVQKENRCRVLRNSSNVCLELSATFAEIYVTYKVKGKGELVFAVL